MLLHDVSARVPVTCRWGSPSFPLAEFCCCPSKNRGTVRLRQRSTNLDQPWAIEKEDDLLQAREITCRHPILQMPPETTISKWAKRTKRQMLALFFSYWPSNFIVGGSVLFLGGTSEIIGLKPKNVRFRRLKESIFSICPWIIMTLRFNTFRTSHKLFQW